MEDDPISTKLWECLSEINRPGGFCSGGSFQSLLPGLVIDGLGMLGLPLSNDDAKKLVGRCSLAPFGRGEKTIHDTSVRNTWQLDPSQFVIANPKWHPEVVGLANSKVKSELGLPEVATVVPKLYKLLLYEEGGFFTPHRDSEKEDGMFATLIILLPSTYSGGELVVSHRDSQRIFDYSKDNRFDNYYTVLYADCLHEVKPVTSGNRIVLIYNLLLKVYESTATSPAVPVYATDEVAEIQKMEKVFLEWGTSFEKRKTNHEMLVIALEHKYSKGGLCWQQLKNKDFAISRVVKEAARKTNVVVHLAKLKFHESGYLECGDDVDTEVTYTLSNFVDANGNVSCFKNMAICLDDVLPKDYFEDRDPDKETEEDTGNEGVTVERWYHASALVLWPEAYPLIVISKGDINEAIEFCVDFISNLDDDCSAQQQEKLVTLVSDIISRIEIGNCKVKSDGCKQLLKAVMVTKNKSLFHRYVTSVVMSTGTVMDVEAFVQLAKCATEFGSDVVMPYCVKFAKNSKNKLVLLSILKEMCIGKISMNNFPKNIVFTLASKFLENWTKPGDEEDTVYHFKMSMYEHLHLDDIPLVTVVFCIYSSIGRDDWLQKAIDFILGSPTRHPIETVVTKAILEWHKWLKEKMDQSPDTVDDLQFALKQKELLTEECIKRLKMVKPPKKPRNARNKCAPENQYSNCCRAISDLLSLLPESHPLKCVPVSKKSRQE